MLNTIQAWLQGFMDMAWSGQVHAFLCDGVPGNCALRPAGTQLLRTSRSLQGFTRCTYRSRFTLIYLSTGESSWMQALAAWCRDPLAQSDYPFTATLEAVDLQKLPNGDYEYTAVLAVEHELQTGGGDDA